MSPEQVATNPEFRSLRLVIEQQVARITLNRPERRNCLTRDFWRELPQALRIAESRDDCRCVLLEGEGPMFSSGIDLAVLDDMQKGGEREASRRAEHLRRLVLSLQQSVSALEECPLPVVAAIQGACIGGALDVVCAADIRLAEAGTFFTPMEVDLGFTPDLGTVQRLSATLPPAVVMDWLLTCQQITAADALRWGFVSRVADHPEALAGLAQAVCQQLVAKSPIALRGVKELAQFTRAHGVQASLRYTAAWQSGVFPGADLGRALQARRDRQAPDYEPLRASAPLLGARDGGG